MKLEKEDYLEACTKHKPNNRWRAIIDNKNKRIGFTPKNTALWIPSLVDRVLLDKSRTTLDHLGIYWIPMRDNEELLTELLKLDDTIEKLVSTCTAGPIPRWIRGVMKSERRI